MATGLKFPVELILKAFDSWSGPLGRAGAKLKTFNDQLEQSTKGAREFSKQWTKLLTLTGAKRLGTAMQGVASATGALAAEFRNLALMGGGAVVGVTYLINKLTDEGDALAKLADRTGLQVNALAEFQFVAQRAGIEVGAFNSALEFFSKNLGFARLKMGAMYGVMKAHAPVLLAQIRATKDTEKALMLMLSAMAKLEDPQKRAAFGAMAFGKAAGTQLANMVQNGTKEIVELRREYRRIMGDQNAFARLSEEWNDIWGDFTLSIVGAGRAILTAVLPVLHDLVGNLKEYVIAHRDQIGEAAKLFALKLPQYFKGLADAYGTAGAALADVVYLFGGYRNFFLFLIGLKLVPLALNLYKVAAAMWALGAAMYATPLGLFALAVLGIAAAIGVLIATWDDWKPYWEAFAGVVGGAIDTVVTAVNSFGKTLGDALGAALTFAFDFAKAFIPQWFLDLTQGAWQLGGQIGNGLVDSLGLGDIAAGAALPGPTAGVSGAKAITNRTVVDVNFGNVPRGTRASVAGDRFTPVNLSMGYSLADGLN